MHGLYPTPQLALIQPAGIGHQGPAHLAMGWRLLLAAAMFLISPDFSAAAAPGRTKTGAESGFVHGMALGATPRYGPDFTHFRYVRPDAPRGGELRLSAMGTFDKLNPFTLKGIAARGVMYLMFESLTIGSLD